MEIDLTEPGDLNTVAASTVAPSKGMMFKISLHIVLLERADG